MRSKRTPIACTECRRRQVKVRHSMSGEAEHTLIQLAQCTGTTPKCERCEKRGMKCEYIPCSQQKAASNDSPPPQSLPSSGSHNGPNRQYSSDQYASQQWQQSGAPFDSSYGSYGQQPVDWQGHPSQRTASLQQPRYGAHGLHAGQPLDAYSQSSYPHQQQYSMMTASSAGSYTQRPVVPSQQSYSGMAMQNGYAGSDATLGSNLNYNYANVGQPMGTPFGVTSTHS